MGWSIGHVIRGKEKWSQLVTMWYPREGKRTKGKLLRRWEDDMVRKVVKPGLDWQGKEKIERCWGIT